MMDREELEIGSGRFVWDEPGVLDADLLDPEEDTPTAEWLAWPEGFPAGLAEWCLTELLEPSDRPARVLDVRAGTGAALMPALLKGCECWGCEAHPLGVLAAHLRYRAFEADLQALEEARRAIADLARRGARSAPSAAAGRSPFRCAQTERQVRLVRGFLDQCRDEDVVDFVRLSLAACAGELARRPARAHPSPASSRRRSSALTSAMAEHLARMMRDMRHLRENNRWPVGLHILRGRFPDVPALPEATFDLAWADFPALGAGLGARAGSLSPVAEWTAHPRDVEVHHKQRLAIPAPGQAPEAASPNLRSLLEELKDYGLKRGAVPGWAKTASDFFCQAQRLLGGLAVCLRPGGRAALRLTCPEIAGIEIASDLIIAEIAPTCGLSPEGLQALPEDAVLLVLARGG